MGMGMVDREQIAGFKQAYMAMFDQIAHPDGSNYPRLRRLIWGAIEQREGALSKQQQSQALSVLTYTTLVTAVACAAATALGIGDQQEEALQPTERAGWCLGLGYALSMTHPESVAGETALDLLGESELGDLCDLTLPELGDATFWGEFRVVGEALYSRLFALALLSAKDHEPLLFALGTGMGLCSRQEIRLRLVLMRRFLARVYGTPQA